LSGLAPSPIAQPNSLPATTEHLDVMRRTLDAPLLARCVEARADVYKAIARSGVASRAARRAVYR
jgi:hypothetical protein